jgi:hypothetical protein
MTFSSIVAVARGGLDPGECEALAVFVLDTHNAYRDVVVTGEYDDLLINSGRRGP